MSEHLTTETGVALVTKAAPPAFEDGTTQEYTQADKEQYLSAYPDRAADVVAMGWSIPEGWTPPVVEETPAETEE